MTKYISRKNSSKQISLNIPGGVPFSEFLSRGNVRVGDIIVGLRDGENSQFTFPGTGILDENDNFLFSYESVGENAVNYLNFVNSISGDAPIIEPLGQDGNIAVTLKSKNNAPINLYTQNNYVNLNDTYPLYGFTTDNTFTDASDFYAPSALAVKTYVDNSSSALANLTYITDTDETADLPNSFQLTATANQTTVSNGVIGLSSTIQTPGTFKIGAMGATVSSISTDGTLAANSDTLITTEKAAKTYIDGTQTIIKAKTYVTNTNETASLPNSQPLSLLPTGIVSVTTSTGILSSSALTGTSNQIDIANGTGVSGNPTFALSSTLVAPGTFAIGMGSVAVTSISNSATATGSVLMDADAIQLAISNQIGGAKSFRGGYDASSNLFPTTGGSGGGGAVEAGDVWAITVAGTLGGTAVSSGDTILALVDTPGQTASNWAINVGGVQTWNGRAGLVTPQSGDYSFNQISGTAAVSQGGTGATSVGASGTLAQSNGSIYGFTTSTYPSTASSAGTFLRADGTNWSASTATLPNTAGSSGTLLQSNGSGFTNTTATYPSTAGTSGTFLTSNGTNIVNTTATYPSTAGTSGTILRSNGTNIVNSTPTFPNTATSGKIMRGDGTNWAETTAQYPDTAGTSGNVLTSDGTNFVSSAPVFVPMPYNPVSASTQALAVNNAYYTTYAGLCTMTLPVTAARGSIIKVRAGPSGNTFRIAQNAGQYIYYGAQSGTSIVTITGTSGYLESVDPNTTVDLECIIADTAWIAISNVNNLQANV